jgi:hypothetical protein
MRISRFTRPLAAIAGSNGRCAGDVILGDGCDPDGSVRPGTSTAPTPAAMCDRVLAGPIQFNYLNFAPGLNDPAVRPGPGASRELAPRI